MEVAMDESVSGKEARSLLGRFEPLHLALPTSCRTMLVFRAIVQISILSMFDRGKKLAVCHGVASQFVGHDHAGHIMKALQQSSEKSLHGFCIPPRLNEDVQHDTILIHGAPKIMLHALDPDEHLVQMPLVARPRTATAQTIGKGLTELPAPAPHCLIGDDNTPFSQKQLDVLQAEAEHVIQPCQSALNSLLAQSRNVPSAQS